MQAIIVTGHFTLINIELACSFSFYILRTVFVLLIYNYNKVYLFPKYSKCLRDTDPTTYLAVAFKDVRLELKLFILNNKKGNVLISTNNLVLKGFRR